MRESAAHHDSSELIAHIGFVRSLAWSLVHDKNRADDVTQEVMLAALRQGSPPRQGLRAWLVGVTKNLVHRSWRTDRRVRRREEWAARPESVPPSDVTDRLEVAHLLVMQVMDLPEPYRSTVVHRWFDELSSKEIADREGIPAGTVRSRLTRALALLRSRMDREHGGDRRAWCLLFLPLALPVRTGAATGAIASTGALFMSVKSVVIVTAVVAALAIVPLAGVLMQDREDPAPVSPSAEPAGTGGLRAAPPDPGAPPTPPVLEARSEPTASEVTVDYNAAMLASRSWLRRLLAATAGPSENSVVREILEALKSPDEQLRLDAVLTLKLARDPYLAKYGRTAGEGDARATPALDYRTVRAALTPLFDSRSVVVRTVSIRTFSVWGAGPQSLPVLHGLLDDPHPDVVRVAVTAILKVHGDRPTGSSVDHLAAVLERGDPKAVRACLSSLRGSELDNILIDCVINVLNRENSDEPTRRLAVECLGTVKRKNRNVVAQLLKSMRAPEEKIMHRAFSGLHAKNVPPEFGAWIAEEIIAAVDEKAIPADDGALLLGVHGSADDIPWLQALVPPESPQDDPQTKFTRECVQDAVRAISTRSQKKD